MPEKSENMVDKKGFISIKQKMWIDQWQMFAPADLKKTEQEICQLTTQQASFYMNQLRKHHKQGGSYAKSRR